MTFGYSTYRCGNNSRAETIRGNTVFCINFSGYLKRTYYDVYFRSPWTNSYEPPLEDGAMPSERLRKLEIEANTAFDQYRELYFEGGVSSVYLWDLDAGFAGVILIKKAGDGSKKIKGKFHDDFISRTTDTERLDP